MDVSPDLRRVKEEVEEEFLARPGVTGVDIGYKEVGGQPTDVLAIRVLVAEKHDVDPAEAIPSEIAGYPTDVIERRFELHVLSVPEAALVLQADSGTYDPIVGGISIGPCRSPQGRVLAGTLGCLVLDVATSRPMLLSNFHVMAVDNASAPGDTMAQPSRVDGGTCPRSVVGTLARSSLGGSVDAAVAWVTQRGVTCQVADIGTLAGPTAASLGMAVRKRGRTTRLTFGTVDTVDLSITLDYGDGIGSRTLTRQVGIRPNVSQSARFGSGGDSGSVVVDGANHVVGLYFAGDDSSGYGVANPIGPVLSALGVTLCSAATGAFYRYWHQASGDHFYTMNFAELGNGRGGYTLDGVQCRIQPSPVAGTVPLHRYWNPRVTDHFYTTGFDELGMGRFGWGYEGVAGFVWPTQVPGTIPLHRYWNPSIGDHFYTTSLAELGTGGGGWRYENIQCYVLPVSATLPSLASTSRTATPALAQDHEQDRPDTFTVVP
jgi:hypothetical protein